MQTQSYRPQLWKEVAAQPITDDVQRISSVQGLALIIGLTIAYAIAMFGFSLLIAILVQALRAL